MVAFPLAATVSCQLLGIRLADRITCGGQFTAALTPADTVDAYATVSRALQALDDYIQTLVAAERSSVTASALRSAASRNESPSEPCSSGCPICDGTVRSPT
ncbi:cytochrome P450 [Nonomuraea guangzhouensis]|uniref:Cytochrome P450 n=1 Tax=Nonomuraea guangzhouensis TaxID=1291555 RepID=A0ABW4GJ67_9ACTN|nr:cytochrome P450 [Nonomuraea guangzhouensis]